MGVYPLAFYQLVSTQEHLAHARVPILWVQSRSIPFHKCFSSRTRYPLALSLAPANDRINLEICVCCGDFRNPPVAGRIGRLDRRTQRCFKRRLFYAHARRVSALHAQAIFRSLSDDVDLVRRRIALQADAGNDPVYSFAARLLAAPKKSEVRNQKSEIRSSNVAETRRRENPAICSFSHRRNFHFARNRAGP